MIVDVKFFTTSKQFSLYIITSVAIFIRDIEFICPGKHLLFNKHNK